MANSAHQKALAAVKATEAFDLYRTGLTFAVIAEKLGVGQTTARRYVRDILGKLAKEQSTDLAIIRMEIKERLLYITSEAMKAWEDSKEFSTKKTTKTKRTGGKNAGDEVSQEVEVGHGDVKFLTLAKDTVDSLSTLYGAAPKETAGAGTISISQGGSGEVTIKTSWGIQKHPIDAEVVDVTPDVKEIEYDEAA